jgi:hypothetical protein
VCCLADTLTHTMCLKEITEDDIEHCNSQLFQDMDEFEAIMEEQDMMPDDELLLGYNRLHRDFCW